jgi:hypothetical protein
MGTLLDLVALRSSTELCLIDETNVFGFPGGRGFRHLNAIFLSC